MRLLMYFMLMLIGLSSCESSFLEAGSDKSKVIPQSLQDFQALLDKPTVMNGNSGHNIGLLASDEYTISDANWALQSSAFEKAVYLWQDYGREDVLDWNYPYKRILYCNTVIEGLQKLGTAEKQKLEWQYTNGSAHFFRALTFFELAQTFCKTYDASTLSTDLGLPLKTESAVEVIPQRSSLADTYNFILQDALLALEQLPEVQVNKERPIKLAAQALLSRIYLYMGDYPKAGEYAERVLEVLPDLLDYNSLDLTTSYTFPYRGIGNVEVIFMYVASGPSEVSFNASEKFLSYYGKDDLRRQAFFLDMPDNRKLFKGSYNSYDGRFTGFSTSELYLNAAESAIRTGNKEKAIEYVNTLGKYRIKDYIDLRPQDFPDNKAVLEYVLKERRKELYGRGLHWGDLKRLNHEGVFRDTLKRTLNGQEFVLLPNSPKYVWPLPASVVELSGLEQN